MTSRKVNEELRVSLLNIKRILCEAGDKEICHLLDRIIQSPDKISALLDALSKKMKRGKKRKWESDLMYKKRRKWFLSFVSTKGEKLKAKDAEELARITKDWELSAEQIDALLAYSTLWNSYPGLFWYGGSPDKNVLRSCFNDLERMPFAARSRYRKQKKSKETKPEHKFKARTGVSSLSIALNDHETLA
ncbi:hypothetical protein N7490_006509 [Penicillium lividum]|nr:hypothetical protein N7490_006509 [Penicillium lividum]